MKKYTSKIIHKKISFILLLVILGCVNFLYSQSQEEAENFFQKGIEEVKNGNRQQAIILFKRSLEIKKKLNINPEAISYNLLIIGNMYRNIGQHKEALLYYTKQLEFAKKYEIKIDIVSALINIGDIYKSRGEYIKSLEIYNEGLAIARKIKDIEGTAKLLHSIGFIHETNNNYKQALHSYEEALNVSKQIKNYYLTHIILSDLGHICYSLNNYDDALSYYENAIKISSKYKDHLTTAAIISKAALVMQALGAYKEAIDLYKQALEIRKAFSANNDGISISLNNIGRVYKLQKKYNESLSYYKKSLELIKKAENYSAFITVNNNIGDIYCLMDYHSKALKIHDESLMLSRKINSPKDIARSLFFKGNVYYRTGQYDLALNMYKESYDIINRFNMTISSISTLNRIGNIYLLLNKYDEALKYFKETLALSRKIKDTGKIVTNLSSTGAVYLKQKEYKKAEKIFIEMENIIVDNPINWTNPGLTATYIATKRYGDALKYIDETMRPEWNATDGVRFQFYTQRGFALKGLSRLKEASDELLKAVLISENTRQHSESKLSFFGAGYYENGRITSYKGLVASLCNRFLNGEKYDKDYISYGENISSNAFYFSELTKARVLLEEMTKFRKQYSQSYISDKMRKKEQKIINELSYIEQEFESAYKKGKDSFIKFEQNKQKKIRELDSFVADICKKYPKYAAIHYPAKFLSKQKIPLKQTEVIFEYLIEQDATYLFIVRKEGVQNIIKIQTNKEDLEKMIYDYLPSTPEPVKGSKFWIALKKKVNKFFSKTFSLSLGNKLYEILLSKAMAYVKPNDNIIIIPDEILGLIPFESLIIKPGKSFKDSIYVGDKCNIVYYQSAAILALNRLAKSSVSKKILLAIGNPVFSENDPRYTSYKRKVSNVFAAKDNSTLHAIPLTIRSLKRYGVYMPLPETASEIEYLADLFKVQKLPPDILLDMNASETNFKKSITYNSYRYIHFATHADLAGKIQGINEPFIVLNQVENNKEDGIITLSEVTDLRLNTDLVVLSACLTGAGDIASGEGVLSFARAFHQSGSKGVVVSLWPVLSKSAVDYMKTFYNYMKDKNNKVEAMKLTRNYIKSKHPNPLYWAVFVLHGE